MSMYSYSCISTSTMIRRLWCLQSGSPSVPPSSTKKKKPLVLLGAPHVGNLFFSFFTCFIHWLSTLLYFSGLRHRPWSPSERFYLSRFFIWGCGYCDSTCCQKGQGEEALSLSLGLSCSSEGLLSWSHFLSPPCWWRMYLFYLSLCSSYFIFSSLLPAGYFLV